MSSSSRDFIPLILILLAFNVIGDTLLLLLIVTSKLRQSLRYWFIFGTGFCDLLAALVSCLWILEIYGVVDHKCIAMLLITAFGSFGVEFINFWYLVALNIDYCLRLSRRRMPGLTQCGKVLVYVTLVILPWISGGIIITLGMAYGHHELVKEIWTDDFCPIFLRADAAIALKLLSCLLPVGIIAVTIVIMACQYRRRNRPGTYVQMSSRLWQADTEDEIEPPYCYFAPCILTIVCAIPIELYRFVVVHHVKDLDTLILIGNIFGVILYAKFAILPYLWLLWPDIRAAIGQKCCRKPETGRATYQRFPEQHDSGEVTITPSEED